MSPARLLLPCAAGLCLIMPSQALAGELAEIIQDQTAAYKTPGTAKPKKIKTLYQYASLNGQPTRLPVTAKKRVGDKMWIQVRLMMRPNGSKGWIRGEHVKIVVNRYRIRIDLSARGLWVFENRKKIRFTRVVVGAPATPTPRGHFFAVDGMRLDVGWAVHGWALATSAFSNVLNEFAGGQGQVAIHTTGKLQGKLGSASSHGCVRVPPRFAKWLALRMPNGTPIEIVR